MGCTNSTPAQQPGKPMLLTNGPATSTPAAAPKAAPPASATPAATTPAATPAAATGEKPSSSTGEISNQACFGAGCYWGTEKFFKKDFGSKMFPGVGKVTAGKVGFMSSSPNAKENPTYKEVCTGTTQHVEVYNFTFEGGEAAYEALVRHFFMFHDPTTKNRQGNDTGTQYASWIFAYDDKQVAIAESVKNELQAAITAGKVTSYEAKTVSTAIAPATKFYSAEEYHQNYLDNNPGGYCNHRYSGIGTEFHKRF